MNRAYRRSKLKEQRQKYKENRMLRKMCDDLSLIIYKSYREAIHNG